MRDQELMERLRSEEMEIPESLRPAAVETLLEKKARTRASAWKKTVAAAAVFLVICGGVFGISHMGTAGHEEQQAGEEYEQIYEMLEPFGIADHMTANGNAETALLKDNADTVIMDREAAGSGTATEKQYASEQSAANNSATGAKGGASYSGTNVQTEQVDEGDIVKTDGKYLYVLDDSYNTLSIVQVKQGKMEKKSVIELDKDFMPQEFYVAGDQLTILGEEEDVAKAAFQTKVYTYDIQDRTKPGKPGSVTQSGGLKSSRMRDGYLYVFSSYYPEIPAKKSEKERYVPMVCDELIEMPQILLPEKAQCAEYLVITAIDLEKPDQTCDRKAIFSSGDIFYVSSGHIYAASSNYGRNTEIQKFSYEKGRIKHQAAGTVKGYLEDSFSMDEYQGNLRLVTTLETNAGVTYNNVYMLDKNMEEAGSILKLAKNERVYSARFMGDIGYFVTYRETDPLFSVDLSDPAQPKVIGKLKIPGFSEYLHFYGENRLLGIGMSTDQEGDVDHVKISMFDISDPKSVKERDVHVLKGCYSAEALYNHHAVMVDPQKNLIGFTAESDENAAYYLFQYDKDFRQVLRVSTGRSGYSARGVYIGEYFYLAEDDRIRAYGLEDFRKVGEVKI